MENHITSEAKKKEAQNLITELPTDGSYKIIIKKLPKTRTSLQNRALYKFLDLLAKKLNDAGLSFFTVLLRNTAKFIDLNLTRLDEPENDYERGYKEALEDVSLTLPKLETPWNKELTKEIFWVPVQKKAVGKEKTSECVTSDYALVYDVLNIALGEQLQIHVPWPQDEAKTRKQ